ENSHEPHGNPCCCASRSSISDFDIGSRPRQYGGHGCPSNSSSSSSSSLWCGQRGYLLFFLLLPIPGAVPRHVVIVSVGPKVCPCWRR
ncbi:unnamed protein product, partial [Ectocarpus sp. 12 AP-2014]